MSELTNDQLKSKYEKIYQDGREGFFSRFENGIDLSEVDRVVLESSDWQGKTVLDIGCGVGDLASKIAQRGAAEVCGVDYAEAAIKIAKQRHSMDNLHFSCRNAFDVFPKKYDIIVTCGTIEHFDEPKKFLTHILSFLEENGTLIFTCPHFINIRGIVYMSMVNLFNIPMTLSDLHFIHPWDVDNWLSGLPWKVSEKKFYDYDLGNTDRMCTDMSKRLTNALKDAGLPNENVPKMIDYMRNISEYFHSQNTREKLPFEGGNVLYRLSRS